MRFEGGPKPSDNIIIQEAREKEKNIETLDKLIEFSRFLGGLDRAGINEAIRNQLRVIKDEIDSAL